MKIEGKHYADTDINFTPHWWAAITGKIATELNKFFKLKNWTIYKQMISI